MLEFDIDSYHRKWYKCIGILKDASGGLFQDYYETVDQADKNLFCAILQNKGRVWLGPLPPKTKPTSNLEIVEPVYTRFASGLYHVDNEPNMPYILLCRSHSKTFNVGLQLGGNYYQKNPFTGGDGYPRGMKVSQINLLKPIEPVILENLRIFSRNLWSRADKLLFNNKVIGFYQDNECVVEDEYFLPYVQQTVGDLCPVRVW